MTATRISPLAPATWPQEWAENAAAPAAITEVLRNWRRVNRLIGLMVGLLPVRDLFCRVVGVARGNPSRFLVTDMKIETVIEPQSAARRYRIISNVRLVFEIFVIV